MAKKKPEISEKDSSLFAEAMKDVKVLTHNKVTLEVKPKLTKRILVKEPIITGMPVGEIESLPDVSSNERIFFAKPGINYKILRKIRQGQYNVEATLDLHGQTVEKAHMLLTEFLNQSLLEKKRLVLIIHGKKSQGKPILKNKLNHWLRQLYCVLAFATATYQHGAAGALYVFLRRQDP